MANASQDVQNEKFSAEVLHLGQGSYAGGVNFTTQKNIHFTYNALRPAGPVNIDSSVFVPENVLLAFTDDLVPLDEITENVANFPSTRKLKRIFGRVQHGRDWEDGSGYSNTKSNYAFPFNIMSSSVVSGYNKQVANRVSSSLELVNLHHDAYAQTNMEIPMQGPFTEVNVGGHQSRHIPLNTGSVLDNRLTRPEAWLILLGKCPNTSGAIGMAGPDYPWPEANDEGATPYPLTGAQKAVYYRGFTAKRPVNIRNISQSQAYCLGNYSQPSQVVQSVGTFSTPRHFLEEQPALPAPVVSLLETVPSASTNVIGFFPTLRRTDNSHFDWNLTYAPLQLTGSTNKTIFIGRFGAPGAPDTMSRGFLDFRGDEYSPYNALPYRNLSLRRPWQPPTGTISQPTGSGVPGIRNYDQLGMSYGLHGLLARHSARFGRDYIFETAAPGATYNQLPSFQKVNRNTRLVIDPVTQNTTASQYDNAYVTHPIPRADRQYSWFTASLIDSKDMRYYGYAPTGPGFPHVLFSGSTDYVDYFEFITGSIIDTTTGMFQPTTRLNIFTLDPVSGSTDNIIGYPSETSNTAYFNSELINALPAADSALITGSSANYFNLLMTRRGNTYGWNWKKVRQDSNPILLSESANNKLSLTENAVHEALTSYAITPVSTKGRSVLVNVVTPRSLEISKTGRSSLNQMTLRTTDNNQKIFFNNIDLDNFIDISLDTVDTAYDKIVSITKGAQDYSLRWVLYSQGIYPSYKNEFKAATTTRTGYDNEFWRNARLGTDSRNTLGDENPNSFKRTVSQSSWAPDAQENFLTRTAATLPSPSWNSSSVPGTDTGLEVSGAAGELQNNYFFYWDTEGSTAGPVENKYQVLAPAGLYARKHMLETPKSVSPWTNIPETGSNPHLPDFSASNAGYAVQAYAGEALWEANTQAGRAIKSGSTISYEAHPSDPWFNDYDNFRYDLKLIAKDYSILPEFRISEHVDDYINYGLLTQTNTLRFQAQHSVVRRTTSIKTTPTPSSLKTLPMSLAKLV